MISNDEASKALAEQGLATGIMGAAMLFSGIMFGTYLGAALSVVAVGGMVYYRNRANVVTRYIQEQNRA
ncbi:MAG: hypothetical protein DRQ40_07475 [Gammaproteobacteria bacterium]|nr:MAG: hypothetical protein DRQ40_07475 [Gammaproteobacteria bacterium]